MTRSKVKVKVTSLSKMEIRPFSKAISPAIYNGSWQLSLILKLGHNIFKKFERDRFFILGLDFVSRDFEFGTVRLLRRVDRQSCTRLIINFVLALSLLPVAFIDKLYSPQMVVN